MIIGEFASNHGGNIDRLCRMVSDFQGAIDIAKSQLTRVKHLRKDDPPYAWFEQAELSLHQWDMFCEHTTKLGMAPLLTNNHQDEAHLLHLLGLQSVKVGSGEAHSSALATAICEGNFREVYLSDGIRPAHPLYDKHPGVIRLACVSRYPNGSGMAAQRLISKPGYDGWSDHSVGLAECQAAIALGARFIEKHVCTVYQSRPPSSWEATVDEMRQLKAYANLNPERFLGRWAL